MVTVDNIMNNLKTDIASLITNAQTALNTLFSSQTPTPTPTLSLLRLRRPQRLQQQTFSCKITLIPLNPFPIGTTSKNGLWVCKYIGSNKVAFENGVLHMVPKAATNYAVDSSGVGYETYACQVQL